MLLIDRTLTSRPVARETVPAPALRGPAVFLPPAEVLRKLQATRQVPPPSVRPTPLPTPPPGRDRISVGGPSAERAKGPILLRREDDLTATARGTPRGDGSAQAQPTAPPTPVPSPPRLVAGGGSLGGAPRP